MLLFAAWRAEIGYFGKIVFGVDAHHERRGVPAAGDHAAVDAVFRRFLVDMIGQRNVTFAKFQDFIFMDFDEAEFMHGAGNIVFEVRIFRRVGETGAVHLFSL